MISRIFLKNWRSHTESELTFSGGVNVLVGEMGAGKSSILEAITFALYGTTPAIQSRTVTLDEIIRRTPTPMEEAVVEVDFRKDGETYTVRREVVRDKGTDTAELRRDGELVEAPQAREVTGEVENVLGIDYDLFARVVYAEQNSLDYFLTLRAGQRKERVDQLLQLDRFETARKTLVRLMHKVEDRRANKQEALQDLEEAVEEQDIEAVRDRVAAVEEELDEIQTEQERVTDDLDTAQEELAAIQDRKQRYDELMNKQTALNTRIETVADRIATLEEEAGPYSDIGPDELDQQQEELAEHQQELEQAVAEEEALEKRLSVLDDRLDRLTTEKEKLAEQAEAVDDLDTVENRLADRKAEQEQAVSRLHTVNTRKEAVSDRAAELDAAADTCPTCGQELTESHRTEMLAEWEEEQQRLAAEIETVQEKKHELDAAVAELEEKREQLLQYRDAADRLQEVEDEIDQLRTEQQKKTEQLHELEDEWPPDRRERVVETERHLASAAELLEVREEHTERQDELEQVKQELDEIDVDADVLDAARDRVAELEKKQEVLTTRLADRSDVLEERRQRLEELEQRKDRLSVLEDEIGAYRRKEEFLHRVEEALEQTQTELRQQFVSSVNQVMDRVWTNIYPYDDYGAIRLNASDGYALEVQDTENNWVGVDGQVSGGERHSAALTLRIALSIVLAPSWRILMLDEPTHNLDVTAIEDLAETLRTTVADIIEQLFLITHEERLETAVTGDLYILSKNDSDTGLTAVERAEPGLK